jgi:hypothetical protein
MPSTRILSWYSTWVQNHESVQHTFCSARQQHIGHHQKKYRNPKLRTKDTDLQPVSSMESPSTNAGREGLLESSRHSTCNTSLGYSNVVCTLVVVLLQSTAWMHCRRCHAVILRL